MQMTQYLSWLEDGKPFATSQVQVPHWVNVIFFSFFLSLRFFLTAFDLG